MEKCLFHLSGEPPHSQPVLVSLGTFADLIVVIKYAKFISIGKEFFVRRLLGNCTFPQESEIVNNYVINAAAHARTPAQNAGKASEKSCVSMTANRVVLQMNGLNNHLTERAIIANNKPSDY